ncbi:Fur-regulated basic protein FbpA [Bacillus sp. CECT 9360]|uniref:Fur-regulated basic protein FbpA n=1 Tax=Bacillus sp. CECT 9360 TaxID=2845821 RepID=UPI001E36FD6B|nr:Fur-regulated basic protein FbpA [Bacillus sp. CECT 9360]CAH0344763.1 hypothetical protein BCI9360_01029 [Bacillus sp. CECT 9360]
MSIQLRNAIDKLRQCYIDKLLHAGVFKEGDAQLYQLTVSELESLCRKVNRLNEEMK